MFSPYDYRGLMVSNTTTYAGKSYPVGYQYDDRGRLEEITYPSGRKATYTFEERSLLDTIAWAGQEIEDRNYNELGLLTGITRAGSAVDETRSYDNLNRVTSIANTNVGTGSYSYDANGNKLSESWSGAMSAWNFTTQSGSGDGYDDEDRFVNFIQPTKNKTVSFTRSNIGNISNVNLNGTNTNRGYSNTHELSSIGSSSQSFDDDGNLTQSHTGIDLDWDEGGMLKQTVVGPVTPPESKAPTSTVTMPMENAFGKKSLAVAPSRNIPFTSTPDQTASRSTTPAPMPIHQAKNTFMPERSIP